MAKSVIEELVVKITGDTSGLSKAVDNAGSKLLGLRKIALGYVGIVGGAVVAAGMGFAKELADEALSLDKMSKGLNANIEDVQRWQYAIRRSNGDVGAFDSTIKKLSDQMNNARLTGRSPFLQGLTQLGINVRNSKGHFKTVTELLSDLSGVIGRMDKNRALDLGKRLGLDESTILLLQKGRKELDSVIGRTKNYQLVNEHHIEVARKLNAAWEDTSMAVSSIKRTIGEAFLPVVEKMATAIANLASKITPDKIRLIGEILKDIGLILGGATILGAILKIASMLNPIQALFIAIGTAVSLIAQDFETWLSGGESLLGGFYDKLKSIWECITGIGEGIKNWFTGGLDKIASFLGFGGGEMLPAIAGAGNTTNNSSSVKVENMNVYTKATDGKGLATDFKSAVNQSE